MWEEGVDVGSVGSILVKGEAREGQSRRQKITLDFNFCPWRQPWDHWHRYLPEGALKPERQGVTQLICNWMEGKLSLAPILTKDKFFSLLNCISGPWGSPPPTRTLLSLSLSLQPNTTLINDQEENCWNVLVQFTNKWTSILEWKLIVKGIFVFFPWCIPKTCNSKYLLSKYLLNEL